LKETEPSEIKEERVSDFNDDDLQSAWKSFNKKRGNKVIGESEKLVLSRRIEKIDENTVCIFLQSELEVTILDRFELKLIGFLRDSLKNDLVKLKKVVRREEAKQKLYTSSDKYDYLVEKNPKLKDLKDKLGLDFEY